MKLQLSILLLFQLTVCFHDKDPDSFQIWTSKEDKEKEKVTISEDIINEDKRESTLSQVISNKQLMNTCSNDDNSLNNIMSSIANQLKPGYNNYVLYLHFTNEEIYDLNNYPSEKFPIKEAENMLYMKIAHNLIAKNTNENTWLHYISGHILLIIPIMFFIMGIVIFVYSLSFTLKRMSYSMIFLSFFFVVFLVQFFLELFFMYEVEVLKQYENLPPKCIKDDFSVYIQILDYFTSFVSIDRDECLEMKKKIYINPIYKVRPVAAFSNSFITIITSPLIRIAESCNLIIKEITKGIPFYIFGPFILGMCIFLISLFIVFRGYRFRSILFSIEPMAQTQCKQPSIKYNNDGIEDLHLKRLKSHDVQKNRKFISSKMKTKFVQQSKYLKIK